MAKIILIAGAANTGKTKSIRQFLEDQGIIHMKRIGDLVLMIPHYKAGKRRNIGVASGGDSLSVVRNSLTFLDLHPWDVIVCASRSQGQTFGEVQRFAAKKGVKVTLIRTQRVSANAAAATIKAVAGQIASNL